MTYKLNLISIKAAAIILAAVIVLILPDIAEAAPSGSFTRVKGQVFVKYKSGKRKARVGMKVYVGNVIQTGKRSRVKLLMTDRTIINLGPNSKLRVRRYKSEPKKRIRKSSFDLVYGKIRAKVPRGGKNDIRFKTPTAVAGVRGTELIILFDEATGESVVISIEGSVNVYDAQGGGGVVLLPGMATNVLAGGVPARAFAFDPGTLNELRIDFKAPMNAPGAVRKTIEIPSPGGNEYQNLFDELSVTIIPVSEALIKKVARHSPLPFVSPEDLFDQEPPPFTPVILDITIPQAF